MVKVTLEPRQVLRFARQVLRQFPFASKKALNEMVLLAQATQRIHDQKVFEIRKPQYWKQAVKITHFAKVDEPYADMEIDPKDNKGGGQSISIWQRQEYGGRVPEPGHKSIALPQDEVKRTSKGIVRAQERPKRVMEKGKRGFEIQFASGNRGLFRRIGRRQKAFVNASPFPRGSLRNDPNVEFLYLLKPRTQVDPVYDFFENAERVFTTNWERIYDENLVKAFADAEAHARRGGTK